MVTCRLCSGYGKRYETVVEFVLEKGCVNCDGTGKVPVSNYWRPFEPSKETVGYNRCNLHRDCNAADERADTVYRGFAMHCRAEDCEDCFGC